MSVSFDRIDRRRIETVADLVTDVRDVREATDKHKLWYRGHSCASFQLLPSIARKSKYGNREQLFGRKEEQELLHRFRRRAYSQDRAVDNAGYALFLARHHGLPTRILDWTANVLFALHFSCAAHSENDGRLWAFRQRGYLTVPDAFELTQRESEAELFGSANDALCIKIVHPVFNSVRLVAQDGGFTWHSDPWRPLEDLPGTPFEEDALDIEHLYTWVIPREAKPHILRELSGLGITHRSMFPDLDGIARSLWETEVLWNGSS